MADTLMATRDGYGAGLTELARRNRDVVALDCDLGRSTRSFRICEVDPERFLEMGIAEQDMVSTAAGLAAGGKIPFVNSFAVFLTGRAFDQIRQQVALPRANVKLCGSSAGITQGADGATHQSVLDVALMRCLPNMTVVVPADPSEAARAVAAAADCPGPVYLRLSRYQTGDFLPPESGFPLPGAREIRPGDKVALVGCGPVLKNVLEAAELLAREGLPSAVYNFPTVKPVDRETLSDLAARYGLIVSVEEHSILSGLGGVIAEFLAEQPFRRRGPRLMRLGVRDRFGESGNADELLRLHGLHAEGIAAAVLAEWKEHHHG